MNDTANPKRRAPAQAPEPMNTYVLLLRGVMPTGKNRVPMGDLRVALGAAGLCDVRTYIQSGNVVARSGLEAAAVEALAREAIARDIGADIVVLARTHAQIGEVLARNPFPPEAAGRTYFSLLTSPPAAALAEELLRIDFAPDDVRVVRGTVYTCYATKLSDSKFNNNFFERRLKVAATTRNFNTLTRLLEMSA